MLAEMFAERVEAGMIVRERAEGAPRLLWIHGLGESGACFEAIAAHPALAGTAALIPDLPGYGASDRADLDLAGVADHLAAWLRARGSAPCVIVGHSMGGVIGVHLAERHPDVVAHLVDVDGNVSLGDCTYSGRAAAFAADAFVERGFAEMRAFVEDRAVTDLAHRGYAMRIGLADPRTFHRHAGELVAVSTPEDMGARLAALRVPVTYVAGAPGGASARSRELLRAAGVVVVEIEPAGHWPFVDQPDRFAETLAGIITRG
jgi:pimeloyl-ACP methyl ester carboxylesterase